MKATLDHTTAIAEEITSFWFKPERPLTYTSGQYIEFFLPHDKPDERGIKHWFTLSSSPTELPLVSITTRIMQDSSSLKRTLKHLRPGAVVTISDPMGDFVLPKDPAIKLLFIGLGIGLTPMRSMVKYLLDTKEKRDIKMIYAVRSEKQLAFMDLFMQYGVDITPVVSEPSEYWDGLVGQLDSRRILAIAKDAPERLIYMSGPEPAVEKLSKELLEAGIDPSKLVLDHFPGYKGI